MGLTHCSLIQKTILFFLFGEFGITAQISQFLVRKPKSGFHPCLGNCNLVIDLLSHSHNLSIVFC